MDWSIEVKHWGVVATRMAEDSDGEFLETRKFVGYTPKEVKQLLREGN